MSIVIGIPFLQIPNGVKQRVKISISQPDLWGDIETGVPYTKYVEQQESYTRNIIKY